MNKILLIHYFPGAGGKFIANCLSLSKKVAFGNFKIASEALNNLDINFLENHLLNTIPKKSQGRQWALFEQGCTTLFGKNIVNIAEAIPNTNFELNNLLTLESLWLPLVSHNIDHINNYKKHFNNCKIFTVLLDSTPEFIDLAIRKKWPSQDHCLDIDQYSKFKLDLQSVKFDFIFENWDPLIIENHQKIQQLAHILNCQFDWNLTKNYVKKYLDFHQN
jgi:hypothetical protein